MDPAIEDVFRHALVDEGKCLNELEGFPTWVLVSSQCGSSWKPWHSRLTISGIASTPRLLSRLVALHRLRLQFSPDPSVHLLETNPPPIQRYDGTNNLNHSCLTLCLITFELQPFTFSIECTKVAYIIQPQTAGRWVGHDHSSAQFVSQFVTHRHIFS